MSFYFGNAESRPTNAENAVSGTQNWESLSLAVQIFLPLAIVAILFGKRKIGFQGFHLFFDTYASVLCPSFCQRQRLLKWMSTRIPHMKTLSSKISSYWKNGSLLCTLINSVVPGACPNPQRHWKHPPTHGQALAFKYLGVAPVLTEKDFTEKSLNPHLEETFIKYLLSLQEVINKLCEKENAEQTFTSKYVARGMGLITGEQTRPSIFYLYPNTTSKDMENVLIHIKGPYGTYGKGTISAKGAFKAGKLFKKIRDDMARERKKLAFQSKAQKSFFRTVSFDISPFRNIVGTPKSIDEIDIKIEIEEDRAKISFVPKYSGMYELIITSDGQHLTGSPFHLRISKYVPRTCKSDRVERNFLKESEIIASKQIGKDTFDQINDLDSGIFDVNEHNDQNNNLSSNITKFVRECPEDGTLVESDLNVCLKPSTLNEELPMTHEERKNILDDSETSIEIKSTVDPVDQFYENFDDLHRLDIDLANGNDFEMIYIEGKGDLNQLCHSADTHRDILVNNQEGKLNDQMKTESNQSNLKHENTNLLEKEELGEEIFENIELKNSQEFEDLYHMYMNEDENPITEEHNIQNSYPVNKINHVDIEIYVQGNVQSNQVETSETDLSIISNIPSFQEGKKITKIERVVQLFEENAPKALINPDLILCHTKPGENNKIHGITPPSNKNLPASPIFDDIVQEVYTNSDKDSINHKNDVGLSLSEKNNLCVPYYSCEDVNECADVNVTLIRNRFEEKYLGKKTKPKYGVDLLNGINKKLCKSLPNLTTKKTPWNSVEIDDEENKFLVKFRENREFWNKIIRQNSSTKSEFVSKSKLEKVADKKIENMSKSNCLVGNDIKSNFNKTKQNTNVEFDSSSKKQGKKHGVIYDQIRIFEKECDSYQKDTISKLSKPLTVKKEIKTKTKEPIVNETKYEQIEEDLDFVSDMRERFENAKKYFKSLEHLVDNEPIMRRHSLDGKCFNRQITLPKVSNRFSLDNLYKDVMLDKKKRTFKGCPNRSATSETLASLSSNDTTFDENNLEDEDLDLSYFNIKKKTKQRKSIKSVFDVIY